MKFRSSVTSSRYRYVTGVSASKYSTVTGRIRTISLRELRIRIRQNDTDPQHCIVQALLDPVPEANLLVSANSEISSCKNNREDQDDFPEGATDPDPAK